MWILSQIKPALPVAGKLTLSAVAGLLGFIWTEQTSQNLALAVVCQSFATIAVAYLLNRHKMADVKNHHELGLLDRLHGASAETTTFMVDRLNQLNKLVDALTITKHAMADELMRMQSHRWRLELKLHDGGIDYPEFKEANLRAMTAEEDKIRAGLSGFDPKLVDRLRERSKDDAAQA